MSTATQPAGLATLIPLTVEARGEVISSNVAEFRAMVTEALSAINREPSTDAEFGQAAADVKALKGAEDAVKAAKEKALKDAEQLHQLFVALDDTSEEIRQARLDLEKQIKTKTEEVRGKLVTEALASIDLPHMVAERHFRRDLEEAVKGKRTVDSMRKALDVAAKTAAGMVAKSRAILDQFEEEHGKALIMDRQELEVRRPDQVEAELRRRLELHQAEERRKEEAEKARIERDRLAAEVAQAQAAATPSKNDEPAATTALPSRLPVADPNDSAREWRGFEQDVLAAFAPVKKARLALRHAENRARAQRFADRLGEVWKALKEEVAP